MNKLPNLEVSRKDKNRQLRSQFVTVTLSDIYGSKSFVTKRTLKRKIIFICLFFIAYCIVSTASALYFNRIASSASQINKQNKLLTKFKKNVEDEWARDKVRYSLDDINRTSTVKKTAFLEIIPSETPFANDKEVSVTSSFGLRNHPILGERKDHNGIDIRAPIGTPVQATADGIVSFSGNQNGYGNVVKITHLFGFQTVFAHLDERLVEEGQLVKKGMLIAKSGNTGRSTGPHLHYEVRHLDKPLDSENFIQWNTENFDYVFKHEKGVKWEFFINEII